MPTNRSPLVARLRSEEYWKGVTSADTPNAGRLWWGWGNAKVMRALLAPYASKVQCLPPTVDEVSIRAPRLPLSDLPDDLRLICSDNKFERLLHARGRSSPDIIRNSRGSVGNPPDLIAFPRTEGEVLRILQWCSDRGVAVAPFGGGSSVVNGFDPPEGYGQCICVDMLRFNKVLRVDEESQCALIQGGVYGPALEAQLKEKGYTLRHFPQSFEFSTLGGWIATRAGGHFATGPTHIDDLVESVRVVSPAGVTEGRRLPGSGAGPAEHRHYIGSEGIYGIIVSAWVRIRRRPTCRSSATVLFSGPTSDDSFLKGARAVRKISQCGLQPANLRLVDGPEIDRMAKIAGGDTDEPNPNAPAALLIGFESPDPSADLAAQMRQVLAICKQEGGQVEGGDERALQVRRDGGGERDGLAGKWGQGFMLGGYIMSVSCCSGRLTDTFETAVTWDQFEKFHRNVLKATRAAVDREAGGGSVTCRFTHIYPDGPAPYYTVVGRGVAGPHEKRDEQWLAVKRDAMEAVMANGGTSTHHHAVGRLHRPHYEMEQGELFPKTLAVVKQLHDPQWVMNPDVLVHRSVRSRL
eukprot:TRINITY_DN2352_c0_g1_i1.p1 TRINITY_DN2352_c0_g1~~TRINITY_DN2352_c0_g1_i1.p1  ORF type:complete len:599 (+),score=219.24 TRINITY_DN2352_c0_g1_i1:61-1797(+)